MSISIICSDSYPIPILSLFFLCHPYIPYFLIERIFHFVVIVMIDDFPLLQVDSPLSPVHNMTLDFRFVLFRQPASLSSVCEQRNV